MSNKTIKGITSRFACLLLIICVFNGTWAESYTGVELPLASDAKPVPDKTEKQANADRLEAGRVKHSVMIGAHEFDALEKSASEIIRRYENGEITADDFISEFWYLVPVNSGKLLLDDLKKWTEERPESYAAWYVLGRQYQEVAMDARGTKWARETSQEQFREMDKYGRLAVEALEKSLPLYERPMPSYRSLIQALSYVSGKSQYAVKHKENFICNHLAPLFNAAYHYLCVSYEIDETKKVFKTDLNYLKMAIETDLESYIIYKRYIQYNTPRWGGSYEDLYGLLGDAREKGMSSENLAKIEAEIMDHRAGDASSLDADPEKAASMYVDAYELKPGKDRVYMLYRAGQQALKAANHYLAEKIYSRIVEINDDEYEAWFRLGILNCEELQNEQRCLSDQIKSAMLGYMYAQNNIGYFYLVGDHGLPVDLEQSHAWLTLAANQGFQHSRDKLKVVEEKMRLAGQL